MRVFFSSKSAKLAGGALLMFVALDLIATTATLAFGAELFRR